VQRVIEDLIRHPDRSSFAELGTLFEVLNDPTDYERYRELGLCTLSSFAWYIHVLPFARRAATVPDSPPDAVFVAVDQHSQLVVVLRPEETVQASLEIAEHPFGGALLPLDDEDVVGVESAAVHNQVRPKPRLALGLDIHPWRQRLPPITVPVVVKINREFVLPKHFPKLILEIDPEAVHDCQFMSLNVK
jgi:hypothetical protein